MQNYESKMLFFKHLDLVKNAQAIENEKNNSSFILIAQHRYKREQ